MGRRVAKDAGCAQISHLKTAESMNLTSQETLFDAQLLLANVHNEMVRLLIRP
jgi:hypothetical protein